MENKIHTELDTRDELAEKRKDIKSFDDLVEFVRDVKENYNLGYGDAPRAIAQACLAVGYYLAGEFGITGFQGSCVMWDFVRYWEKTRNRAGLRLVDYDDMLFPQYAYKFEKTISAETWENLQSAAAEMIRDADEDLWDVHPDVYRHWESILAGEIPFGYKVEE